jgi:hypothetical protein
MKRSKKFWRAVYALLAVGLVAILFVLVFLMISEVPDADAQTDGMGRNWVADGYTIRVAVRDSLPDALFDSTYMKMAWIKGNATTSNFADPDTFLLGYLGGAGRHRALVWFDIAHIVPADEEIVHAIYRLTTKSTVGTGGWGTRQSIQAFRIVKPWLENNVTYNQNHGMTTSGKLLWDVAGCGNDSVAWGSTVYTASDDSLDSWARYNASGFSDIMKSTGMGAFSTPDTSLCDRMTASECGTFRELTYTEGGVVGQLMQVIEIDVSESYRDWQHGRRPNRGHLLIYAPEVSTYALSFFGTSWSDVRLRPTLVLATKKVEVNRAKISMGGWGVQ